MSAHRGAVDHWIQGLEIRLSAEKEQMTYGATRMLHDFFEQLRNQANAWAPIYLTHQR